MQRVLPQHPLQSRLPAFKSLLRSKPPFFLSVPGSVVTRLFGTSLCRTTSWPTQALFKNVPDIFVRRSQPLAVPDGSTRPYSQTGGDLCRTQRSKSKAKVKSRTGFDLVPGINCPSVTHKSGLSCREQRKRAIAGSESRTTLNVGNKLGFTAQRQFNHRAPGLPRRGRSLLGTFTVHRYLWDRITFR